MISDALTRLSGTRSVVSGVVTETGQDIFGALAATPLLSENYMDLANAQDLTQGGNLADGELFAVFTPSVLQPVSSGNPTATIRFQLVTMPRTVAAGQTFTTDFATNDEIVTCTGDYLPDGTAVTLTTSTTLPAGLSLATTYFVFRDGDITSPLTTFKLSTNPDGVNRASPDVVSIAAFTNDGTGTHTITHRPQIIADSGEVELARVRVSNIHTTTPNSGAKADQVMIRANPLPQSLKVPLHRYLFARYVVSHNLSGSTSKMFCDVGIGVPDNRAIFHASGFEIA